MSADSAYGAMLVITADRLDPAKVTEALGLQPDQQWRKGDRASYRTASGELRKSESIYDCGGWKLWLREPFVNLPIEEQLRHWGHVLDDKAEALSAIRKSGAIVVMDCFISTSSTIDFHVRADLQTKFSALGIDLYFLFHAHSSANAQLAV